MQISDYEKELEIMKNMSQEEYVAHVRRYSLMKHNCLWIICYCLFFLDQKYPVDYCAYVKSRYKFTEHIWEELWVPLYMEGTAPSCACVHACTLRPIMWRNGGIGYFILCWGHLYNWFVLWGYLYFRQSSCFSRGASAYRGVTRWLFITSFRNDMFHCLDPQCLIICCGIRSTRRKDGKWQARIGRVGESRDDKDIYLGTYGEQSTSLFYCFTSSSTVILIKNGALLCSLFHGVLPLM